MEYTGDNDLTVTDQISENVARATKIYPELPTTRWRRAPAFGKVAEGKDSLAKRVYRSIGRRYVLIFQPSAETL